MSVFEWMKKNRTVQRTALAAYVGVLLLSAIHSHPHFFANSLPWMEISWTDSTSRGCDCEKNDPSHSCALCDAIRLAGTGVPVLFADVVDSFPETPILNFESSVVLGDRHSQTLTRGPPTII